MTGPTLPEIGFSWSGQTSHYVRPDSTPTGTQKLYPTLCGRGVPLYVPGKSVMPHHLSHVYPRDLKLCKACNRRNPGTIPETNTTIKATDDLPPGTIIYYKVFYDGYHHQLAEKNTRNQWHIYQHDGNYNDETHIPDPALHNIPITVLHLPRKATTAP